MEARHILKNGPDAGLLAPVHHGAEKTNTHGHPATTGAETSTGHDSPPMANRLSTEKREGEFIA